MLTTSGTDSYTIASKLKAARKVDSKGELLSKQLSIILEDRGVLSEICGVNDSNLTTIEELMETRVLSRGNELLLESGDSTKHALFKHMVRGLEEHVQEGQVPGPDHIKALYESFNRNGKADSSLKKNHIIFPSGLKVFPRTLRQASYIDLMNQSDLVFGIGPAGTGKTYLAVAHALREVLAKKKRKLVLTRPVVEAGESLGFLPGDLTQKISPYLRPLYDAMDSFVSFDMINRMEENRVIEIAPLAYMRGRSIRDSYIILDEAQNTTREQMKMFLTRLGEGSQVVVTGDITQIDLPSKSNSGLLHAREILQGIKEIAFVEFSAEDVVRHSLVQKIVQAYEAKNQ
ncbi:MAG: PhoH family protein [Spirochaetales bacterium]|jgi:phosphate starvation-inducible protein PhoH and related proteins|nr:PhoH family protein [Spirochaetales bacterium]